ncbi:RDD family protein [Microbacterium sp. STN6]|uniref:RDD family protein n=1 Tax=Microbacterium sp. STN6 TaxID=2995588 RepID=UPI002260DD2C|nr:RDD family protein [Microbacterium sp. STN6]MCX7521075.1 RDD family protein [Microbacterium sp. STN6]
MAGRRVASGTAADDGSPRPAAPAPEVRPARPAAPARAESPRRADRAAPPDLAASASVAPDELITGEAVALDVRPASFMLRAAGTLIDWLAYGLLFLGIVLGIVTLAGGLDSALQTALVTASLVFALVIVPMVVEVSTRGRSLGRWALGLRIVRDDGGAIRLRHAFIRSLTGVVEIFMTFGGIAALVSLLNARAKRLGDLLAGTYSQHERVPNVIEPVFGIPESLSGWASVADVARLPDRLSRRIAAFLRQAPQLTPASRGALASELANEAAPFVSPLPSGDPELFLAGVAAMRRDRDFQRLMGERERMLRLHPTLSGLPHGFPDR